MSLHRNMDAKTHITIGKALASLREQGVLIIGSGAVIHDIDDAEANMGFADAVGHAVTSLSPSERLPGLSSPLIFSLQLLTYETGRLRLRIGENLRAKTMTEQPQATSFHFLWW
jgi:hypothetical protein